MNQASDTPIHRRPNRRPRQRLDAQEVSPLASVLGDTKTMAQVSKVLGPYVEGERWRLCLYKGRTRIKSVWCSSEAEARVAKEKLERALIADSTRTIGETLDEYLAEGPRLGRKANTVKEIDYRLRKFLPLDLSLCQMTRERAQALYDGETRRIGRYGKPLAAASHRATLKVSKVFFRWVQDRGYLEANPFASIKPIGKPNAGKPQLRLSEAQALNDHLILRGEKGDELARALLLQLVLGLRSQEVLSRAVRDLDNEGREIWIDAGKTKNARRRLEIKSEPLRRLLLAQTTGKHPHDLLFGEGREKPYTNPVLWKRLKKYCADAGVPKVCPHSLRGLHSTLAMQMGATSGLVSAALGHSSFAITAKHYVDPTALSNSRLEKVAAALERTPEHARGKMEALTAALKTLAPDQLAALLASVGKGA